jgi:hypothetical protein
MKNQKLTFKVTEELRKIVAHTMAGSAFRIPYSEETVAEPLLWLVHDQGVYLMSARVDRLTGTRSAHLVAYAEGCDPEKDEDWWEASRCLVGGDDFGMDIPAQFFAENLAAGATSFGVLIRPDGEHVELTAELPDGDPAIIPDCPPFRAKGAHQPNLNQGRRK